MKKVLFFFLAFIASVAAFAGTRVTSLDQLSNSKAYTIHAENGYGYLCYAPQYEETYLYVVGATVVDSWDAAAIRRYKEPLDESNPNHLWKIKKENGNYYLYNLGAKKYAKRIVETERFAFTDEPTPIAVTGGDTFAFGDGGGCVVINQWATTPVRDGGSATPMVVEEVEYSEAGGQVTALDQLSNDKTYTIHAKSGFGYICNVPGKDVLYIAGATETRTENSGWVQNFPSYQTEVDKNDPNNLWQVVESGENYYLYNVGAKKYATFKGDHYVFTEAPAPIQVKQNEGICAETGMDLNGTFSFCSDGVDTHFLCISHITTEDPVRWWTYDDTGSVMIIEEAEYPADQVEYSIYLHDALQEYLNMAKAEYENGNEYTLSENLYTDPNNFYSKWSDPEEGSVEGTCDGDPTTYWHSSWHGTVPAMGTHDFYITLPEAVSGSMQLAMTRRQGALNDYITAFDVYASTEAQETPDGTGFESCGTVKTPLGEVQPPFNDVVEVVKGDFTVPEGTKQIRFVIAETNRNKTYGHFAEFQLFASQLDPECYNAQNPKSAAALKEAIEKAESLTQPTEEDIQEFVEVAMAYAEGDQPEVEPYAVNFDKDSDATRTDRYLNGVSIAVDGGEGQSVSISSRKPYVDMSGDESAVFTCKPGERLTATFNYSGVWMHGYVYIDEDNDKQFSFKEGSTDQSGTELKAFSFYSGDFNQDEHGVNSEGQTITGDGRNVINPPSFDAPQQPGEYRIRFKVDWNSVDPGGQIAADGTCTGPNGILNNGGVIFDAILRVVEVDQPEPLVAAIRLAAFDNLYFSTTEVADNAVTTYSLSNEPEYFTFTPTEDGGYILQSTSTDKYVGHSVLNSWDFSDDASTWYIDNLEGEPTAILKNGSEGFGVDSYAAGKGVFTNKMGFRWVIEAKKAEEPIDPMPQAGKAYFIRTESFGTSDDVYYVGAGQQPETEPVAWLCSVDENGMYSFMNETGDVLHFRGWDNGGATWSITPMTELTADDMNQGSLPVEYVKPEVVVMRGYHSDGRFIYLNVNFATGNYDHGSNVFAPWNSSYDSFFVFEETEVFEPVIEWNGEINVKEEAATIDELLEYPVEFKKAQGLSVSPLGLLGAIFNESGDVYAVAFVGQNYEQFGSVEVKGSTFNVQFEKVADIKDELKESVIQKIGGFKPAAGVATVYFCPKSFVFDGATYGESLKWEYTLAGSGNPTGIESVGTDNAADVIYDLQGRRVVAPVKGNLYIQNGKKVMK